MTELLTSGGTAGSVTARADAILSAWGKISRGTPGNVFSTFLTNPGLASSGPSGSFGSSGWTRWGRISLKQLSALGASTFAGGTNLHQHAALIEQLAQVYEKLGSEEDVVSDR